MDYTRHSNSKLFVVAALIVLGGCAASPRTNGEPPVFVATRCAGTCQLDIDFQAGKPPQLPHDQMKLKIKGGTNFDFSVPGASSRKITLIFDQPAFVERQTCKGSIPNPAPNPPTQGQYVIELKTRTCLTALGTNACPADGCKYTIVDRTDKMRKPLDPWIILD